MNEKTGIPDLDEEIIIKISPYDLRQIKQTCIEVDRALGSSERFVELHDSGLKIREILWDSIDVNSLPE